MKTLIACALALACMTLAPARAHASHAVALSGLAQTNSDGTALCTGCVTKTTGVILTAVSDASTCDSVELYQMQVELQPVGAAFTGTPNYFSPFISKPSCTTATYTTTINNLAPNGYHWQAREYVQTPSTGTWTQFNAGSTAFTVGNQLVTNPTSINFGGVRSGSSSTVPITVTANGQSITINTISTAAPFSYSGITLPLTLAAGASAMFSVTYSPTATGNDGGSLTLTSTALNSPTTVALSGQGTQPKLTVLPTSVDFMTVRAGTSSTPVTLTLTSTGVGPVTVTSGDITGPFVVNGLGSAFAIAQGASQQITVQFAPTAAGAVTGSLNINSDDAASPAMVSFKGTGVVATIAANPSSVDFGTQTIGSSTPQTITLTAGGGVALDIMTIAPGGANAGDFLLTGVPTLPLTLNPGQTASFVANFSPTASGTRTAQVTITSDAISGPLVIPLTGVAQGPTISVGATALDLGASNVGTAAADQTVTVGNTGQTNLQVTGVTFSGANPGDFTSPTTFPIAVAPGASTSIALRFTPSAVGARSARATVASNDTVSTPPAIDLTGTGTAPMFGVAPSSLDFGDTSVSTPATQTLTITNSGTGPLQVTQADLSGNDAAHFSVAANLPLLVPAGGTAQLPVQFSPVAIGAASAQLTLLSDDPNNARVVVPLTGNGISPTIAVAPTSLDFGGQLVGRPALTRTIDLSNTGTGALQVQSLVVGGAQASSFQLINAPQTPFTVPAGGKQTLTVGFTAAAVGQDAATLTITSTSVSGATVTVPLAGAGLSALIGVSPMSIDFGTLATPAHPAPQAVMITNLGGDAFTLVDGSLAGSGAASFSVTSVAGTLQPGQTATAMVSYQATAASESTATLSFAAVEQSIPVANVQLHGKAVSSVVGVNPMMLDFAHVTVGSKSAPQTVIVTNLSSDPLQITGVTSTDPAFAVDTSGLSAPIAGGKTATFSVTFAPTQSGERVASLSIAVAGTPTVTVSASGTGDAASGSSGSGGCSVGGRGAPGVALALALIALLLVVRRRRCAP